ncbi:MULTISPECIES: HDOD domain-containing protein [Stenotrophomonas]|jgi:HD-like signal output (HDOD) protein|uniref:HDOD domain-containing protein n=1 Tax=Stenotrophomonas TaxID=40323 RepID=UPI00201CD790|nr:HDOD domain-containing protein [Stenotrophomonas rhizophila]UQY86651.1 HDOD domain-containing protein [Stenotrophomonas rhizophila]
MMVILAGAGVLVVAFLGWGWYRRPAEAGPAPGSTGGRARTQPQPPTPTQPCSGDADQVLQAGLHALALQPGGGSAPATVAQDAALLAAVAAALEAQDWSARHLPRRPQLLPQLIQTVNDSDASARSMASIISQDAVLTGNLLRIANSPVYRLQAKPVDSLQRAVTLVGTEGIRQIISAVLVQPVMQLHSDAFPQFGTVVWEHALLASRAAADHARLVTHEDGFAAQWMGLTQGLGAALVMRHLLDVARDQAVLPSPQLAGTLLDAWTLPVASRIAAAWELPPSVHQALLRDADATGGGLAASLHFARAGASASLLCRHGRISQAQALALLEQLHDTPAHALQWIWRRLHGRAVETLEADESADA